MVIRELQADAPNRSACFPIIVDIKTALASFHHHQVVGISRRANSLVHELVARARRELNLFLIANAPLELQSIVTVEALANEIQLHTEIIHLFSMFSHNCLIASVYRSS